MSSKRWCSLGQTPRKGSGWLLARALSPLGCMPARERGQALASRQAARSPPPSPNKPACSSLWMSATGSSGKQLLPLIATPQRSTPHIAHHGRPLSRALALIPRRIPTRRPRIAVPPADHWNHRQPHPDLFAIANCHPTGRLPPNPWNSRHTMGGNPQGSA